MDVMHLDYLYWQLVHSLVLQKQIKILEINQQENEVILESEKEKKLYRLVRFDFDWSNHIKRDLNVAIQKSELLRKYLSYRQLEVDNMYISLYPPVDSWEHIVRSKLVVGKGKKTKLTSYMITGVESESADSFESIYHRLQLAQPEDDYEESIVNEQIEGMKREIKSLAQKRFEMEKKLFTYGKPRVTYIFLAIILIMFALLELNGGSTQITTLIDFGAKYNPYIEDGQWWRFFTAIFLHIGWLHLFMNTIALYYLGTLVEKIFGSLRFFVIFFIAGLFGSVASYAFNIQVSAGASGAIFGCFGALLYFGVMHQKLFFRTIGMNVLIIVAINIAFGFLVPMIDNSAHIGGLVGGFLASAFLQLPNHKRTNIQWISLAAAILLAIGIYQFGLHYDAKIGSPYIDMQYAQELIQQDEIERAFPILEKIVNENDNIPEAFFLLAYVQAITEQYEEAKTNLLKSIELKKNFHEAYYNLALIYYEFGEKEKALESVQRAIEIQSVDDYVKLEKILLQELN